MVGAAVAVLALSAYSDASASGQTRSGGGGAGAPLLPTPLATSVQAGGGTWATVAMGDLGQPLDTFWQLLFRPSRASSWSDRVEATAVATNGGLVLASGSNSLVVGVRPSNNLTFSPLISTSDGGRSWSNGLLNQGLVSRPQALASARTGARWRSSRVAREPKWSGTPRSFGLAARHDGPGTGVHPLEPRLRAECHHVCRVPLGSGRHRDEL